MAANQFANDGNFMAQMLAMQANTKGERLIPPLVHCILGSSQSQLATRGDESAKTTTAAVAPAEPTQKKRRGFSETAPAIEQKQGPPITTSQSFPGTCTCAHGNHPSELFSVTDTEPDDAGREQGSQGPSCNQHCCFAR